MVPKVVSVLVEEALGEMSNGKLVIDLGCGEVRHKLIYCPTIASRGKAVPRKARFCALQSKESKTDNDVSKL